MLSITDAAKTLRTTPRMLRYRESLGLLPSHGSPGAHRRYDDEALRAAAYAITLEQTYDVSPSALAFALRVLNDPVVNADVRRLSQLTGPDRAVGGTGLRPAEGPAAAARPEFDLAPGLSLGAAGARVCPDARVTGAADRDRSDVQERLGDVLGSAPGEPESDDEAFEQVRERVQALISAARTLSDTCADLADALRPLPGMAPDDPIIAGFGRLRAERTAALLDEAASAARGTLGLLHSAYGALDSDCPRVGPPARRPRRDLAGRLRRGAVADVHRGGRGRYGGGAAVGAAAPADATDPHGIPAAACMEQTAIAAPEPETTGEPIGTAAEEARPEPVEVVREPATSTTPSLDDSVGGPDAVPDEAHW